MNLKAWLLGVALATVVAALSPTLRAKAKAALSALAKRLASWLFLSLPGKLNYAALTPEQQAIIQDAARKIIYQLVRVEEILLPDSGLGPEKKKRVLAKLSELGFPDCLANLSSNIIDDAVQVMNTEAREALKTYAPQGNTSEDR